MPSRSGSRPSSDEAEKTRFMVRSHWRTAGNRHHASPVETFEGTDKPSLDGARRQAWDAFHHAAQHVPLGAIDYTVDLLEAHLRRIETERSSYWALDGETRQVARQPGDNEPRVPMPPGLLNGLAERLRAGTRRLADPCLTCGSTATDYTPTGDAYCAGHLPRELP